MLEIQSLQITEEPKGSEDLRPRVIKWKGESILRNQSFLAAVQEIIDFASEIDVVKVGIVGDPHSGKTTMGETIAHCIHKHSKVPFTIRKFQKEDLLNFRETLKTLSPVNHVLLFGDLSFMGADATKKQIEMVKQASTQIRHIEGGRDVKIISIYDYHYTLGLDKYLRQADFKFFTTVGSSELGNMENIVTAKYMRLVREFQKYRLKAVTKKYWSIQITTNHKKEPFAYKYRNPFIPALFYNNDSLRLIISPTRQWIDPICSICSNALGTLDTSNFSVSDFVTKGENTLGEGSFKAAVKLNLYVNGLTVYSGPVVQALRWIERARMKNQISLEQLATHYGLIITKTKLKKKPYEPEEMPGKPQIEIIEPVQPKNEYSEYDNHDYNGLVRELENMAKLPIEEVDIPKYEYLNNKAREIVKGATSE